MNKTLRYLILTVSTAGVLAACESISTPALAPASIPTQDYIFEAEMAQFSPGGNTAERMSLQDSPRVASDDAARGGKAFYAMRTDDKLVWDLQNRPQGTFEVLVRARAMSYKGHPELELQAGESG